MTKAHPHAENAIRQDPVIRDLIDAVRQDCAIRQDRAVRQDQDDLTGVTDDSRRVRPGMLFLACPGHVTDGRHHIAEAIRNGAAAVLYESGGPGDFSWREEWTVPHRAAANLRVLAGPLAHALAGHPSERLALLGVTGTNGKTSVTQWLARAYPEPCAVIGTLGAGFPERLSPTGLTTPEATLLSPLLAEFAAQGARAVALEASSIGIAEGRLDGLRFDTAIFTNLTRDHLDYHQTMEAYAAAKATLFGWPSLRLAIVNLDDPFGIMLARTSVASRMIGYTLRADARHDDLLAVLRAENLRSTATGQVFRLATPRGGADVETALAGAFNVANLLAVAAVLFDRGLDVQAIAGRLALLTPPPGRMERLGAAGEPLVVVDYAHTPDALENALAALRPLAQARGGALVCVFGCGGERDRGKRPLMGEIAAQGADRVFITSDNPRGEPPLAILQDIAAGLPGTARARLEADRAKAIGAALAEAAQMDVILIAGKGHEAYQEIAGTRHAFSDRQISLAALAARPKNRSAA
jgi:UDP-N-acetylmuramyl-tripeptide synthetase